LGVQLHAAQKQGKGERGDGDHLHGVQPAEEYVHFGGFCALEGPERAFFAVFGSGVPGGAPCGGSAAGCSVACEQRACAGSEAGRNLQGEYFTDCVSDNQKNKKSEKHEIDTNINTDLDY